MSYSWKNRRVLVTGAGGFIGSHLTEALVNRGAKVRALVRYNSRGSWGHLEGLSYKTPAHLDVVAGDIRDPFLMQRLTNDRDVVFHLAALIAIPYSYIAPQNFVETNVAGTLNVLEASRQAGVKRVIHTSTSETYGTACYIPMDETHPLQAQSPYSASKIAADKLAESYYRSFDLPVVTVRPFNTFGPRQSARAVIPTILSSLLTGSDTLRLGDLRPVRDFTFVKDTVNGFILAAESAPAGTVMNVGSGKGWSVRQIVAACAKATGRPIPTIIQEARRVRPGKSEVWRLICDNRKARRLTGWKPTVSLVQGLAETSDYIREHLHLYKPDLYNV